jgi:lipid-binding SYLF domain-containing protein
LFAGVALKGATLRAHKSDNKEIYGKDVEHQAILQGRVPVPASANSLIATLNNYWAAEK